MPRPCLYTAAIPCTRCLIILATPKFPYVPESRKNRVPNCPPQEMAESRTCHPQKMAESATLVSLGVASPRLCHFWGWPVWVSGFWHIWGLQEGSDTLYVRYFCLNQFLLVICSRVESQSITVKVVTALCYKALKSIKNSMF